MHPASIVILMITLVVALSLLLAAGVVIAEDTAPKTVRGQAIIHDLGCEKAPCEGSSWQVKFCWDAAQPPPDGYRLDYAFDGKWQSYKKSNTPSKGAVFVSPAEHGRGGGYRLSGIYVPYGKRMCFRLKARYRGAKDGPWTKLCLSN